MQFNRFFHFYFLNIDMSVTIQIMNLKCSMCVVKFPVKGSVSQILDLVFIQREKTGYFLHFS